MGMGVPLDVLVEVRMGVEVEDGELRVAGAQGPEHGVGDRVVAAQGDRPVAALEQAADALLDQGPGLAAGGQRQVAGIGQPGEVLQGLGPGVAGIAVQGLADGGRRLGRPPQIGGTGVVGQSDQGGSTHGNLLGNFN